MHRDLQQGTELVSLWGDYSEDSLLCSTLLTFKKKLETKQKKKKLETIFPPLQGIS